MEHDEVNKDKTICLQLEIKNNQTLPNLFHSTYRWLRDLKLESDLVSDMNFLHCIPLTENLKIRSANLIAISNLNQLKWLEFLDLEQCQIERINDYGSYLKLVKLYAIDQEHSDHHHVYSSSLKIGKNPYNFKPTYSEHYPMANLADLAAQNLSVNDLSDEMAEFVCHVFNMSRCPFCKRILPLKPFWVWKGLGLLTIFVQIKMCHTCLVQEYKKVIKEKNRSFLCNFENLIQDLNQIIEEEIADEIMELNALT